MIPFAPLFALLTFHYFRLMSCALYPNRNLNIYDLYSSFKKIKTFCVLLFSYETIAPIRALMRDK